MTKPKGRKRVTDKERLDFLQKNKLDVQHYRGPLVNKKASRWQVQGRENLTWSLHKSARRAIDAEIAAIRASREGK